MADKTIKNIRELLKILYLNRDLLNTLFDYRNSMKYSDVINLCDGKANAIEDLLDYDILERNEEYIEIGSIHRQYFENVTECDALVEMGQVDSYLKAIKNTIDILNVKDGKNNSQELHYIRKRINDINAAVKKEAIVLKRQIQETYATERDIRVKLEKLEQLQETFEVNRKTLDNCHAFFDSNEMMFTNVIGDMRILSSIANLRKMLLDVGGAFITIGQILRKYIGVTRKKSTAIKKARRLLSLCKEHTIRENTNIDEVAKDICPLLLGNKKRLTTFPSLDYLSDTDTAQNIILRLDDKFHTRGKRRRAEKIPLEFMEMQTEVFNEIPYETIFNSFSATRENLFDYIQKYKFDFDVSYSERVDCFLDICIGYFDKIEHFNGLYKSDEYSCYPIIIIKK